ncbi:MAG: nucleotidyltransferase domain-containing protein [Bacteroidota bacterium]
MILTKEQIQKIVSEYFAEKPVKKAWLFGSYARGEADEDSDVDVLVDIDYDAKIGWQYFSWHTELGSLLNKKVDVVSAGWESKYIKPFIDRDKSIIYER